MEPEPYIVFNAVAFTVFSLAAFMYFVSHSNGIHKMALFTSVILAYPALIYSLALFGVISEDHIGPYYLRPVFAILGFLPLLYLYIGWHPDRGPIAKINRRKKHDK